MYVEKKKVRICVRASVLIESVIKQRLCTKTVHQIYTMPTQTESRMIAQMQNTGQEGDVMKIILCMII